MKFALISDIHGNLPALEAVWEDIRSNGIEKIYSLGDSLDGPLWPEETARFLINHSIENILGNGEEDLIAENVMNTRYASIYWQLSPDSIEWLHHLKHEIIWEDWTMFHASPGNLRAYLLEKVDNGNVYIRSSEEIENQIQQINTRFIACGHSHVPHIVSYGDRTIVNAGSVGLPAYGDDTPPHAMQTFSPMATYVIVDQMNFSIRKVSYDYESAARRASTNGRSDWSEWLMTGRANS